MNTVRTSGKWMMLLSLLPSTPPSPAPRATSPHYGGEKEKKKKIKESAHPELSGWPASQSASCTLAVSSGLDIEEGSAASAAAAAASAASAAAAAPSLYMRVCVCEPDEMKFQDQATSRGNLSIL